VDVETDARYVPEFNSLVLFRVPRQHLVEPVTQSEYPRFSIFGWFLEFEREITEEDVELLQGGGGY
jgi:Rps23 Pro-64 3,4-dihydroxylase Tpa1-like proline 4-hydroxylase